MSTVVKDLGAVSAYAYAVEKGYTGTEAEFAELMADYAEVGQRAEDAADSALDSKTAAQTAATTATNKATEATTAATTATTKAGEASTSASTATSAKDTAVSAASTATTKATEATTAAATATSAATTATTAKDDAVSAKTAAQTAQTGAETAAASVQSSAAQIQTNADDISELKEDLTTKADLDELYKAFPTDTASGSVASFADGANVPVKSLIVNIDPVQEGSGDPSPTNVRPISGWTGCNVEHAKNVFATLTSIMPDTVHSGVTITNNSDDSVTLTGTCTENVSIDFYRNSASFPSGLEAGKQYIVSIGSPIDAFEVMAFKGATITPLISFSTEKYALFTIPSDATGLLVRVLAKQGIAYNTTLRVKMCSADGFALYLIDWTTEAGTVYGGKLDVVSGELVIDGILLLDLSVLNISDVTDHRCYITLPANANSYFIAENNALCNKFKPTNYSAQNDNHINFVNTSVISVLTSEAIEATHSAWKEYLQGTMLYYRTATPITIQLTPHEVTALLGSNNIWADTGDSAVEYRADPTLYIQRLTEPDADMVADSNITSGQYFMVGNTLYKATANIASGATISPNVNCTRKSLSEALNEINA